MDHTLKEAATRYGRSVRQLRYAIEKQELTATTKAGRIFVRSEDVEAWLAGAVKLPAAATQPSPSPRSERPSHDSPETANRVDPRSPAPVRASSRTEARARKKSALKEAVEEVLELDTPSGPVPYSLSRMRVFTTGRELYLAVSHDLGDAHPAASHLSACLQHIACGANRFLRPHKAESFNAARDHASLAVCELLVGGGTPATDLADRAERELIPALSGLLRRSEGRRR